MTSLRRITYFGPTSREGRLLAAGKNELPEAAALRRVAQRLGVSATVLGVASATGIASATGVASTTGVASATAASGVATTGTSLLSFVFVKAIVVGVGIGASVVGAAEVVRHRMPSDAERSSAVATQQAILPQVNPPNRRSSKEPEFDMTANTMVAMVAPDESARVAPRVPRSSPALVATPSAAETPAIVGANPPVPASNRSSELTREVASLDRARTAVSRGDAAEALREIDEFERHGAYRTLNREVMLVRIEALLTAGRREEAGRVARRLLQLGAPATQRARLEQLSLAQP